MIYKEVLQNYYRYHLFRIEIDIYQIVWHFL